MMQLFYLFFLTRLTALSLIDRPKVRAPLNYDTLEKEPKKVTRYQKATSVR